MRTPIDFTKYSEKQLGAIYKETVGYNGHEEGWTREEMIEILSEYHADPNTDGVRIPENIDTI